MGSARTTVCQDQTSVLRGFGKDIMTTDHKGYKVKDSMDWQDKLILWACVAAVVGLLLFEVWK